VKTILLFGAGKSATVLINFLLQQCEIHSWQLKVADVREDLILLKTKGHPNSQAISMNIQDDVLRASWIQKSDIVISMMPPALHILIARDCIEYKKSLLTASYVDDAIRAMHKDAEAAGILFLCEMGLDPGIDHMSAMQVIDHLKDQQATITSFKSHCGGLIAPESDNNPWHYKISWNPRNVVLAGKSGALYLNHNQQVQEPYESLFDASRMVQVEGVDYAYYPNRNSIPYINLYKLHHANTFFRTTLRHPDFMRGWQKVIQMKLTDEHTRYQTNGLTPAAFFKQHLQQPDVQNAETTVILNQFNTLDNGVFAQQMRFLGWNDDTTSINLGEASAADVMQWLLENKLALQPQDKDRIVMLHEIEYLLNDAHHLIQCSLVVDGDDASATAMAKTVGLPLGIAAVCILNGSLKLTGVHVPVLPEIYNPVLKALETHGIRFHETHTVLSGS
jgi:saccharopine dehydrogenase-like NADP-dependent oxidoreductase